MRAVLAALMLAPALTACAQDGVARNAAARAGVAVASCYGRENGQTRTAQGKPYDPDRLSAAHKSLPFGTRLRVTFRGRSAELTVNDRGPYVRGREFDLSLGTCRAIGLLGQGVGAIAVEILP